MILYKQTLIETEKISYLHDNPNQSAKSMPLFWSKMLHHVTVHNIELSDCPTVCQSQVNDAGFLLTQ
jgi:hypothetical protein